jgi:hypothetical protein
LEVSIDNDKKKYKRQGIVLRDSNLLALRLQDQSQIKIDIKGEGNLSSGQKKFRTKTGAASTLTKEKKKLTQNALEQ